MRRNRILGRTLQAGLCGVTLFLGASSARADTLSAKTKPERNVCVAAFTMARQSQLAGDLVSARALYDSCSRERCGEAVWQECMSGQNKLHSELPSVVVAVSDHNGEPLVDVRVQMDGKLLTSKLDGLALPVNPGTHEFLFFAGKEAFAPQTVTVAAGDRNHVILATGRGAEAHAQR